MSATSDRPAASGSIAAGATYKEYATDPALAESENLDRIPQTALQSTDLSQIHPLLRDTGDPRQQQQQPFSGSGGVNGAIGYLSGEQTLPRQHYTSSHPDESYYASHPSPRSTHGASASQHPSAEGDSMAATAHMQRPYPPIYHTPQSNSPASVASPQSHDHGRQMFPQPTQQLPQTMYYPQYQPMSQLHQPQYGTHPSQQQHQAQIAPQPMLSYQATTPQMQHPQASPHASSMTSSSPRMKVEQHQQHQHHQQPPQIRTPMMPQQHVPSLPSATSVNASQNQTPTSASNSNAAPGPIPATTPLVVRQDNNGVQWIAFEYSRDRVKMEYTIRCDVESVQVNTLTPEFKSENCVYPRACVAKEQYKGNRLAYESECNTVGWALAELNPCLRGKRGLIQRAVDSWRNSNSDPRLRSRRVRRQAKMTNRQKLNAQHSNQVPGSAVAPPAGLPGTTTSMAAPTTRPPGVIPSSNQQLHHHHAHPDGTPVQDNVGAENAYNTTPQQVHRQNSMNQHVQSPTDIRQNHIFPGYQPYPTLPTTLGPSMTPSMQPGMHHLGRPHGNAAMASAERDAKDDEDSALFGDVPEGKKRKFILVEDTQRNCRVRVKVQLDQVEMSEIPDSYRKQNSVYPRSYYPVQMQTTAEPAKGDRFLEMSSEEEDDGVPTMGRTTVPVPMVDGDSEIDVPRISRSKRDKEQKLNELGCRMAWSQGRVFASRTLFLQRALDAYRTKQRSALLNGGQDATSIPPHLETRPGKRRWHERTSQGQIHTATPPPTASE